MNFLKRLVGVLTNFLDSPGVESLAVKKEEIAFASGVTDGSTQKKQSRKPVKKKTKAARRQKGTASRRKRYKKSPVPTAAEKSKADGKAAKQAKPVPASALSRYERNPILRPESEHGWESKFVFNPAAVYKDGKVHLLYRAVGEDGVSVLGYASSQNGYDIDDRSEEPAFAFCDQFTVKARGGSGTPPKSYDSGGGWNGGCEDPRLIFIEDEAHLIFTAFDGWGSIRIGMSTIATDDFLNKRWNWSPLTFLSPPDEVNKNWVLFPEKIRGKFAILHSISPKIQIAYVDSLKDLKDGKKFIESRYHRTKRGTAWDSWVRGAGPPPIWTKDGWLLLYHAMDDRDPDRYKLGAMLLDLKNPEKILARSKKPILEPDERYENDGFKPGVVYCCGATVKDGRLLVYYGGADSVVCIAEASLDEFLAELKNDGPDIVPSPEETTLTPNVKSMPLVKRSSKNPLLWPNRENDWEAEAAFNGCALADRAGVHLLYRAESTPTLVGNDHMRLSTIGHAVSKEGTRFKERTQLIRPEHEWERFGCEDPRVTKLGGKNYIFYTALSTYPFSPDGIKVGLAITKDFKKLEKHPVTTFNAKAMALFPGRVKGKMAAILTVNTDRPPAQIALAFFDKEEDIWSEDYWNRWYADLGSHALTLARDPNDHVEVGAPPILIKEGWLVVYSYIRNYFGGSPIFGIEAVLLDKNDPTKILSRTERPILVPEEEYELYGRVPNVVFPTGAYVKGDRLHIYYGAADTTCCLATCRLPDLLSEMRASSMKLERAQENPIIAPNADHAWEAKSTCNPGAVQIGDSVGLLYRAISNDDTSTLGFASLKDGVRVDERLPEPVYVPREPFEQRIRPGVGSGCEDARLTLIGNTIHMCYTAYNGTHPRIALTSISKKDFMAKRWNWTKPTLISQPEVDDKDAALFPKKFGDKYAILHRLGTSVWIDFVDDLAFEGKRWLGGRVLMSPRSGLWDSRKIGIGGPPIETEKGWLLLYHGISKRANRHYHVRAALLDLKNPAKVIARTKYPIFEPEAPYEREGLVPNVVFPCGSAVLNGRLHVYYGGGDKVVGVATIKLSHLIERMLSEKKG